MGSEKGNNPATTSMVPMGSARLVLGVNRGGARGDPPTASFHDGGIAMTEGAKALVLVADDTEGFRNTNSSSFPDGGLRVARLSGPVTDSQPVFSSVDTMGGQRPLWRVAYVLRVRLLGEFMGKAGQDLTIDVEKDGIRRIRLKSTARLEDRFHVSHVLGTSSLTEDRI